ncbi:thioredoxin [Lachnotalea sp. AF33-28]|jgi:thioredoxin 1|uniref:thioredoxin n=1 Tax=Lachnotalea sp. AF33-28 TaxID=2292046 RepID=UPI000E502C04|nr:thioredoxin [Lachnotalea sp. AF33-28]RHP30737.1 thioredoxin [Lachnotalea sp. AF33-28]
MALQFQDSSFKQEVLESGQPVLVDFYADWCGPCKMLAPIVEDLAAEYADRIKIGKLNVDQNMETAAKYGVQSIPTLILFKGGEAVKTVVGLQSKAALTQILDSVL